jgi:GNAT superfamily N-acetyltransferase
MTGIMTAKHPYHRHAEVTHFLVWRDRKPAGRVSVAINRRFNEHHNTRIGFFGFFEVVDDYDVACHLLDAARTWVTERGMNVLRGPGEYSNATHERQGILIDGFQYPPTVELTHNPPYYRKLLEHYGFSKAKDYYAYILEVQTPAPARLTGLVEQVRQRRDIRTRALNIKDVVSEVNLMAKIYNESWANNWGFLPITREEAEIIARSLLPVADPGLIRFAFIKDEPIAVFAALPDAYCCLRPRWRWFGDSDIVRLTRLFLNRRRIPLLRLMMFGIRPGYRKLGVDALLYAEAKEYAMQKGYRQCEASLLLEDNGLIISPSEFMAARHYKTWRIYDLKL